EPPWLRDWQKLWKAPEDTLDEESISALNHLLQMGGDEAWEADPVNGEPRCVLEDRLPWELVPERRGSGSDEKRLEEAAEQDQLEHPAADVCSGHEESEVQEGSAPAQPNTNPSEFVEDSNSPEHQSGSRSVRLVLERKHKLLVTGGPGAGKKALTRSIISDLVTEQVISGVAQRLPLRLRLSDLEKLIIEGVADPLQDFTALKYPSTASALSWERLQSPPWPPRLGHQVILLDKRLLVIGGLEAKEGGRTLQDIWASDDLGVTWSELPTPTWTARQGHQVVVHDGKLVLMGGMGDEDRRYRDAWESSDGGCTWQELPCPRWPGRSGHQVVLAKLSNSGTAPREFILLLGGSGVGGHCLKDAWSSDNGGFSWHEREPPPWQARSDFRALSWNNQVFVIGGVDDAGQHLNDVWVMSGASWAVKAGGRAKVEGPAARKRESELQASLDLSVQPVTWECFSGSPWAGRSQHEILSFRGQLVIFGGLGSSGSAAADAWASKDGACWKPLPSLCWSSAATRWGHKALTTQEGQTFVVGGRGGDGMLSSRLLLLALEDVDDSLSRAELADYLQRLLHAEPRHQVLAVAKMDWPAEVEGGDEHPHAPAPDGVEQLDPSTETMSFLVRLGFAELRVKPLEDKHVRHLCRRWMQGMPPATVEQVEAQLVGMKQAHDWQLQELMRFPLVGTMMLRALVPRGNSTSRKPLSLCELYEFALQRCFQSHSAARTHKTEEFDRLHKAGLTSALCEMAFDALGRNSSRCAKAHELAAMGAAEGIDKFVKLATSGQLLLFKAWGNGGVEFRFPSMQDYTAAKHVWRLLQGGKPFPLWMVQENAAGQVSEAVVSCARFFCLQAHGLRKPLLSKEVFFSEKMREGLGFLLRLMCKAGDHCAVRCLIGVAHATGRQALMATPSAGAQMTALHLAATFGHSEAAAVLLELASDPMALCMAVDANGLAPLHCAALHGHEAAIQVLLTNSPDGHALLAYKEKSSRALTSLHLATIQGHEAVVKYLLAAALHPVALCAESDAAGNTPLHLAASNGHTQSVQALLTYAEPKAESQAAAAESLADRASLLLTAVNKYDKQTALHLAADRGKEAVVCQLLKSAPDKMFLLLRPDKLGQTALHVAAEKGHHKVVGALLRMAREPTALVNIRERIAGQTALHMAAEAGHDPTVRVLLGGLKDNESLVMAKDHCGRYTALHLAAEKGHLAAVEALLELAPDRQGLLHAAERFAGQTSLHLAAAAGHGQVARCLLELAPKPGDLLTATDKSGGFTPLQLASEKGHAAVVEILLELAPDRASQLKATLDRWSGFSVEELSMSETNKYSHISTVMVTNGVVDVVIVVVF
ncbi:unnamed protein product, partial [Polarella glacialis]